MVVRQHLAVQRVGEDLRLCGGVRVPELLLAVPQRAASRGRLHELLACKGEGRCNVRWNTAPPV